MFVKYKGKYRFLISVEFPTQDKYGSVSFLADDSRYANGIERCIIFNDERDRHLVFRLRTLLAATPDLDLTSQEYPCQR